MSGEPDTGHGFEEHAYDVVVVGAGGAGLRAAIAAHDAGGTHRHRLQVPPQGRAHRHGRGGHRRRHGQPLGPRTTGGCTSATRCAAARCSTTGGWRSCTPRSHRSASSSSRSGAPSSTGPTMGSSSQRDLRPSLRAARPRRRPHGLEMIRTLQQRAVALGIDVYMECTVTDLLKDGDRSWARSPTGENRSLHRLQDTDGRARHRRRSASPTRSPATPGSTPATGMRWRCARGAVLVNMEFVQFTLPGWSGRRRCAASSLTEFVRGDGGVLRNSEGKRFMFDYIPEFFKAETADTEEEADRWYGDKTNNRRPPELLPRDEVARAINSEIKAGRGSPHGGVFLDIASRRSDDFIKRRLPSMYHQFKELADVDITAENRWKSAPPATTSWAGSRWTPTPGQRGSPGMRCRGGRGRHARLEPARRQLPVRPAGLRSPGRTPTPPPTPSATPTRRVRASPTSR